jgi:hypothetical protein
MIHLNGWTVSDTLMFRSFVWLYALGWGHELLKKNDKPSCFEAFGQLDQEVVNNSYINLCGIGSCNRGILVSGSWILWWWTMKKKWLQSGSYANWYSYKSKMLSWTMRRMYFISAARDSIFLLTENWSSCWKICWQCPWENWCCSTR